MYLSINAWTYSYQNRVIKLQILHVHISTIAWHLRQLSIFPIMENYAKTKQIKQNLYPPPPLPVLVTDYLYEEIPLVSVSSVYSHVKGLLKLHPIICLMVDGFLWSCLSLPPSAPGRFDSLPCQSLLPLSLLVSNLLLSKINHNTWNYKLDYRIIYIYFNK